MNFPAHWQARREWIDRALDEYLPPAEAPPTRLHQAMRYSVLGGGKRLRPMLVLDSVAAVGGEPEKALLTACAFECVHTYSLIHDDLPCMDDDDFRRGRPSCHRAFDEATALLAGDALLTLGFQLAAQNAEVKGVSPERVVRVVAELSTAAGATGMVGGQVMDLEAEHREPDAALVEAIHLRKTTALIRAAVRCGAILGGATEKQLEALTQYGKLIGLAFQIMDDVLDIIGDEKTLGKPVGRDQERAKVTYPYVFGLEQSQARAQELIAQAQDALSAFGSEADPLRALATFIVQREQ
ncbi:MAG TPA: polyprenyl synthetase family protein [Armatimonadetes bacterium]|nr:polyprenyl synthetase family protein [Armatimonadota bacterium]